MYYAAIGGMQLKRWTGYFHIIIPTMKVLRAAKTAQGCVHADTFKSGKVFFAVSVWEDADLMRSFAQSGLHGQLTDMAMSQMALFYNHTQSFEAIPDRDSAVSAWADAITVRGGKGTVGQLTV